MDAYHEVSHHADQEANRKKKAEILRRWRKLIRGAMVRARLLEEYGDGLEGEDDDKDSWVPEDDDDDDEGEGDKNRSNNEGVAQGSTEASNRPSESDMVDQQEVQDDEGGGFMVD